ncbi:MAG: ATP-binding protein, partial [Caulobacteraceae bacterium]
AALVLAMFAAAQSAMTRANADLRESNRLLQEQMAEREKAEDALRQSQKMEALGQLTGGIAHDFNNLLMVVSSGVDLMERSDDPARRKTLTDAIRQAVERGTSLTRQLLGFARRAALKPEVVDLGDQIAGLRLLLDRSLREDITVDFEVEDRLWPVEVDPGEFELALLNLAVNARDAMPNGGKITICVDNDHEPPAGLSGPMVKLTVADTGKGMAPGIAERVFEPFFTTKEVGKGTGLGLSQVYGFARASGGDVRIRTREGQGTAIEIYLPRSNKPLPEKAPSDVASPDARPKDGGRILLVEDDDAVASMVTDMLDGLGYRITRAANAEAGLATLKHQGPFDLVFSDTVMPGDMDGIAMAREIRRKDPNQALLLTTGYSEAATAALNEGFSMLAKPYRLEALGDAVRAAQTSSVSQPKA